MIFLVFEILFYLVAALAIGFIAGWLFFRMRARSTSSAIDHQAQSRVEVAEAVREKIRAEKDELIGKVEGLEAQLDDSERRRELQVAEIASLKIEMSGVNDKDTEINKYRGESDSLRQQLRTAMETSANYRSQLELKARETAEYRLQAEKARQHLQRIEKQVTQRSKSLGLNFDDSAEAGTTSDKLAELQDLLALRDIEIGDLRKLLDEVRTEANHMREQTEISRSQLHALEVQVKDWQDARSTKRSRSAKDESTRKAASISIDPNKGTETEKALRHELNDRTRKYAVLKADYNALRKKVEELKDKVTNREQEVSKPETPVDDLADYKPKILLASPHRQPDDLMVIFGIGPVIQKTLNSLGIFYYDQIAELTEKDVRWVAKEINSFPKRIVQDNWVGQAEALAAKNA